MTQRYNTGSRVPSGTVPDLNDNMLFVDEFINKESGKAISRTGKEVTVLQEQVSSRIDGLTETANNTLAAATDAVASTAQNVIDSTSARDQAVKAAANAQNIADANTYYIAPGDPDGTISGLAGTPNGKGFRVAQGLSADSSFIYYLNENGVAKAVSQEPGKNALDEVKFKTDLLTLPNNEQFTIFSKNGPILNIDRDGLVRMIEAFFDVSISAPLITGDKAIIGGSELSSARIFGDSFIINSRNGPVFAVDSDATARVVSLAAEDIRLGGGYTFTESKVDMGIFVIKSNSGPVFAIDEKGTVRAISIDAEEISVGGEDILSLIGNKDAVAECPPRDLISADLIQVHYGQSQSEGQSERLIHPLPFDDDSLMLNTGIRNIDDASLYLSLTPLYEESLGGFRETFSSGQAIKRREFLTKSSFEPNKMRLLFCNGSRGSTKISQLAKGTQNYTRLLNQINSMVRISESEGRTALIETFNFVQGGTDDVHGTPISVWMRSMKNMMQSLKDDLKESLYPLAEVPFLSVQLCNYSRYGLTEPLSGAAHLQLHNEKVGFYVCCPMYWADFVDGMHWTAKTQVMVGAYLAIAKKKLDQHKEFNPLMPIGHEVIKGKRLLLKFNPVGKLVHDVELVREVSNFGFTCSSLLHDGIHILKCSIVSHDSILIEFSESVPDDLMLHYGRSGQVGDPNSAFGQGRINGNRGNIRDSQGDVEKIDIGDGSGSVPLHNWCVFFTYKLNGELL